MKRALTSGHWMVDDREKREAIRNFPCLMGGGPVCFAHVAIFITL